MLEKKLQIKPSFKQFIIDKLKLANPLMKMSVSTYFTADQSETFTKVEEVDGKLLYKEITPGEHGFEITEKIVDAAEKERLMKERGIDTIIHQQREIYANGDSTVIFDEIPEIGLFLEVQGDNEKIVNPVMHKIGYHESQFVVKPYNQFVRKKEDETVSTT